MVNKREFVIQQFQETKLVTLSVFRYSCLYYLDFFLFSYLLSWWCVIFRARSVSGNFI